MGGTKRMALYEQALNKMFGTSVKIGFTPGPSMPAMGSQIATELAAKAVLTSDEAKHKIMSRTPMKRLGQPSEIADVVAWLASDAASYVTGEIVTVDGGRMTLNYTVPV